MATNIVHSMTWQSGGKGKTCKKEKKKTQKLNQGKKETKIMIKQTI